VVSAMAGWQHKASLTSIIETSQMTAAVYPSAIESEIQD